jgi:hypothetical protein
VAEAVHACLAGERPRTRTRTAWSGAGLLADPVLEELARGLLRAYHCALVHHAGRRAADRRTDRATTPGPDPVPAG